MSNFGRRGLQQPDRAQGTDRRTSPRRRVLLRGKIVYGSGVTADCAIRDLSRAGACVVLPMHKAVPRDFHLIVVRDGVMHRSRTLWTRFPLAGLVFEACDAFRRPVLAPLRLRA